MEEMQSRLEEACNGGADEVDVVCDVFEEGEGFLGLRLGRRKRKKKG